MSVRIAVPHEPWLRSVGATASGASPSSGSVIRDDFTAESGVDVLVEFEPDRVPGLITLAGYQIELSELLGRAVDMRTAGDLSRYFREEVLAEAEDEYVAE